MIYNIKYEKQSHGEVLIKAKCKEEAMIMLEDAKEHNVPGVSFVEDTSSIRIDYMSIKALGD